MPYTIRRNNERCPEGKPWAVVNTDTGALRGWHSSKAGARAQQESLYAHAPDVRGEDPDDAADSKLVKETDDEPAPSSRVHAPVAYTTPASLIW